MIDTAELLYSFSQPEARVLLSMLIIPYGKEKKDNFLDVDGDYHYLPNPRREQLDAVNPGILKFGLSHDSDGTYYLRIVIHLESLLECKRSNRLYVATNRNNQLLRDAYALAMFTLFPGINAYKPIYKKEEDWAVGFVMKEIDYEEAFFNEVNNSNNSIGKIPYLWLSKVKKIDFSVNLCVADKEKYLRYAKKTFFAGGKLKQRAFKGNNNVYGYNSSRSVLLYDKALKYQDVGIGDNALAEEASNVVRYEVRIKPNKEKTIKLCGLVKDAIGDGETLCGLLPWLNEDIAWQILEDNYKQHIGTGKWVNRYSFNKTIDASKYSTEMKGKLKRLGELVGQSKSVRYALEQFIRGKEIGKSRDRRTVLAGVNPNDDKAVRSRKQLFSSYIKKIRQLGIQPMRLTDKEGTELANPFTDEAFNLQGYRFYISEQEDCLHVLGQPLSFTEHVEYLVTVAEIEDIHAKHLRK